MLGHMRLDRTLAVLLVAVAAPALSAGPAVAGPNGDPPCAFDETHCQTRTHIVRQGEWLWGIARQTLRESHRPTGNAQVKRVADMLYADNRRVIGPNPDRIRPGQQLTVRHPDYAK
jgi:nucleoid-associated protein YgaU